MADAAEKLTKRQKEVLDRLKAGKTPAEIAKALSMTTNAVYQYRRRFEKKGLLKKGDRVNAAPANSGSSNGRPTKSSAKRQQRRRTTPSRNGHRPAEVKALETALKNGERKIETALKKNAKRRADLHKERIKLDEQIAEAKMEDTDLQKAKAAAQTATKAVA